MEESSIRFLALVLALLLAGCLSGESPTAAEEPVAPAAAPVNASAAPEVPTMNATEATEAGWVPTSVPLAYEGQTGTDACVPAGPNMCVGGPSVSDDENTWYTLDVAGVPQSISFTVSWSAATPATQEFTARLLRVTSCGDECWEGETIGDPVRGPSPLAVSADGLDLAEDERLAILVDNAPLAPRPPMVYYRVSVEQAFKVEGEVIALAPAA